MTDVAVTVTPVGSGWVQLPVEKPKRGGLAGKIRGRGQDRALNEWAAAKARETLGPKSDPDAIAARTEVLTTLTLGAQARGEGMAFAWYPDPGAAPFAQMSVSTLLRGQPKLTVDQLEKVYAWRDDETRQLEVARMELPVGPAVRVRREQAAGDGPEDVVVSVTYAALPPRMNSALTFMMYWPAAADEPVFTEAADATARSLRVAD